MQDFEKENQKVFRYTKKEVLASLLGILVGIFFLFFGIYDPRSRHFTIHSESIFVTIYYMICFVLMAYFFHLWLRRRSFIITVDDVSLIISRFDKTQTISWENIKSCTYQCGHPYWFLSLHLTSGKRINLHGKLEDFDELVRFVKDKVKYDLTEFQYTIRKRISIFIGIFCISSAGIMTIWPLIDWLLRRMPWIDFLGFILLSLFLYGWILSIQLHLSQIKIFVNDYGLTMKSWIGNPIFIPWLELKDSAQIEYGTHQANIAARIKKIIIRVKNKSIYFCEDLDNVDELVNIVKTKAGLKLSL